jgi:hypothetical protein
MHEGDLENPVGMEGGKHSVILENVGVNGRGACRESRGGFGRGRIADGGGLKKQSRGGGGIVEEENVGFGVRESKGSGVLGQHGRDAHAPFLGAVAPVEFWRFLVLQGRFV